MISLILRLLFLSRAKGQIDELKRNLKTQTRRRKIQEKDLRSSQVGFNFNSQWDFELTNVQYYERSMIDSQNVIKYLRDINEQLRSENEQLNELVQKLIEEAEQKKSFEIFRDADLSTSKGLQSSMHPTDSTRMDYTSKNRLQKKMTEMRAHYEGEIKRISTSFADEVETLYQMISDQNTDTRAINQKLHNVDYLYQNVKGDYEIIVRGIKNELKAEKDQQAKIFKQIKVKDDEIEELKLEIEKQKEFVDSCKDLKHTYKLKSKKLKEVVRAYQKKYHDIDIKFMHEEIQKMNYLKDYAKSTIADLENLSKQQQGDIKSLLDYIIYMIGSGFSAAHFEQSDLDEIDEAPALQSFLKSPAAQSYLLSNKNMFKIKRQDLQDHNGEERAMHNLNMSDELSHSMPSIHNMSQRGVASSHDKFRQVKQEQVQLNLDEPTSFSELQQIDYDNDRARFRHDFEDYMLKRGQVNL